MASQTDSSQQKINSYPLGLPFGQTHMPNARFNLFNIDHQEMHLNMLHASFFDPVTKQMQAKFELCLAFSESGNLHLCSRSIVFDSDNIGYDLVKLRFNQQFDLQNLNGEQLSQIVASQSHFTNPSSLLQQNNGTSKVPQSNSKSLLNAQYNLPKDYDQIDMNFQEKSQGMQSKTNTSKQGKIMIKKGGITNKNRTSDSLGSISPNKQEGNLQQMSFRPISNASIRANIEDPVKFQYLKEFYNLLNANYVRSNNLNSSAGLETVSFYDQLQDIQLLLISVKQIIKMPRSPPGPQYLDKSQQQQKTHQLQTRHLLFALSPEEQFKRQSQFLFNLQQFIQPDTLSQGQPLYLSEEEILEKYIDQEKKTFMNYVKHTEQTSKQKYLIKQVVKRVTIEGEHTCLFLIRNDLRNKTEYTIDILPIMNAPHQTVQISIPVSSLKFALPYRYMFQHTSIRLVTIGSLDEYIIVFKSESQMQKALQLITGNNAELCNEEVSNLNYYMEQWQQGRISNGDYLLYINFMGNRSFNDTTQYPVFPWVLQDFKTDRLDLKKESTMRDLSKPLGALSADKLEQFKSKYFEIINKSSTLMNTNAHSNATQDTSEKPFLFLSHYSTPGIALYYLIRQVPSYILKVQNEGYGGPPDRIFYDVNMSYYNGMKVLADNKELIPEFYFGDGTFLKNIHKLELGLNHLEAKVNHVTLPPWATCHLDFILKMRQALESNYVSANLHKWIDLVFGYLQRGERASLANNLFNPTTMEENVDFTSISNQLERQALEAQIRNFGQCPVQVLKDEPHPDRFHRNINLTQEVGTANANQANIQDGLEEQIDLQMQEISSLRKQFEQEGVKNEENLLKQMQEFKHLDEIRKKRITRYKEEGDKQIKKYKQMVEFLKQQKQQSKSEAESKFREREIQYLQLIENLKSQLCQKQQSGIYSNSGFSSGAACGEKLSINQQQIKNNGMIVSQTSNFIGKQPESAEYLKSLDGFQTQSHHHQNSSYQKPQSRTGVQGLEPKKKNSVQQPTKGTSNITSMLSGSALGSITGTQSKHTLKQLK